MTSTVKQGSVRIVSIDARCWSGNVKPFRGVVNLERTDASGTVTPGLRYTGFCKSHSAALRNAQALAAQILAQSAQVSK